MSKRTDAWRTLIAAATAILVLNIVAGGTIASASELATQPGAVPSDKSAPPAKHAANRAESVDPAVCAALSNGSIDALVTFDGSTGLAALNRALAAAAPDVRLSSPSVKTLASDQAASAYAAVKRSALAGADVQ